MSVLVFGFLFGFGIGLALVFVLDLVWFRQVDFGLDLELKKVRDFPLLSEEGWPQHPIKWSRSNIAADGVVDR